MESISKFAKNNKIASSPNKAVVSENKSKKIAADPFARPVKNIPSKEIKPDEIEIKEEIKEKEEEGDDK